MEFCSSHLKKKEVFHGNQMGWFSILGGKAMLNTQIGGAVAQFLVGWHQFWKQRLPDH